MAEILAFSFHIDGIEIGRRKVDRFKPPLYETVEDYRRMLETHQRELGKLSTEGEVHVDKLVKRDVGSLAGDGTELVRERFYPPPHSPLNLRMLEVTNGERIAQVPGKNGEMLEFHFPERPL